MRLTSFFRSLSWALAAVTMLFPGGTAYSSFRPPDSYPCDAGVTHNEMLDSTDTCNTKYWGLTAYYGIDTYEEGEFESDGMCGGGYTMCDCTDVDTYALAGATPSFSSTVIVTCTDEYDNPCPHHSGIQQEFYWTLHEYYAPNYVGCSSGSCSSNGQIEQKNPYDDPYQGQDYTNPCCNYDGDPYC